MGCFKKMFGEGKNSAVDREKKKSLFLQGTTKIDLLAILIQSYSDSPHEVIDTDTAQNILNQIIPGIEQCMVAEIRIQQEKDYEDTVENSVAFSKEYDNSDGTYITGLISAQQNDVPITVSISLLVNGIRSITGNTACIIMKTPTSWAANLTVM